MCRDKFIALCPVMCIDKRMDVCIVVCINVCIDVCMGVCMAIFVKKLHKYVKVVAETAASLPNCR